jgi:hypothetical protein
MGAPAKAFALDARNLSRLSSAVMLRVLYD